ncbi:M23 family metallopeptidase [Candidatus Electronema sp. PJ]|uniref:M23 family metallopeptidase n=1 Tax=Candidatus Electronema sp. PJ TaxID=3401572 RepID=UPI003AA98291
MIKQSRRGFGSYFRSANAKELARLALIALSMLVAVGAGAAFFMVLEFEQPTVAVNKEIKFVGGAMALPLQAADKKSGIQQITVTLRHQNGSVYPLFDRQYPRQSWFSQAGPSQVQEVLNVDVKGLGLKEGGAELLVTVHDFSLKRNSTELRLPVTVDSKPPLLMIEHAQMHLQQGGSGMVLYSSSEPLSRHGVMIEKMFFPGFPLPGKDKTYITYIALAWDSEKPENTRVIGTDEAGNEAQASFSVRFKKAKEKRDRIEIPDSFLQNKLPEFQQHYPEMKGTDVEKYLFVNQKVRVLNAEKISNVCRNTAQEQLWQDRFLRMPGAGRAAYADQRTYYYKGQEIDQQTHLGIDIASNEKAEVRAANRGRVVFADYLGIYGNMVIIDHGQGLSSLYSHLSRLETSVGKMVEKDEIIGRTGTSGMAAGDHLHFSMLVHGIFVTPVEWWDQHWIDVNINNIINQKPTPPAQNAAPPAASQPTETHAP